MSKINLFFAVALLALVVSLAGCGGGDAPGLTTSPVTSAPFTPPIHGGCVAAAFAGNGNAVMLAQDSPDHWTAQTNVFCFSAIKASQITTMSVHTKGAVDAGVVVKPKGGSAIQQTSAGWVLGPWDYAVDIPYPGGVIHAYLSVVQTPINGLTARTVAMDTNHHAYPKSTDGFYQIPDGALFQVVTIWSDGKGNNANAPDGYEVWGYDVDNGNNINWTGNWESCPTPGDVHYIVEIVPTTSAGMPINADVMLIRFH
jgi:hypothetical protein